MEPTGYTRRLICGKMYPEAVMHTDLFHDFLTSGDALRVYENGNLLFASEKDRLLPLFEYIDNFSSGHQHVVIFDKIMGNAAALLSVKAGCQKVYSPLGSQLAITTLDRYRIRYHLTAIVPYIIRPSGEDMCPMEKLSIDKNPEEFYLEVRNIINQQQKPASKSVTQL